MNTQQPSQTICFRDFLEKRHTWSADCDAYLLMSDRSAPLGNRDLNTYMSLLPVHLREEIKRYRKWEDRHNGLMGKLLLYLGFWLLEGRSLDFNRFQRDVYGKPFVANSRIHFNISHSSTVVLCLLTTSQAVGVDIETIKATDIADFKDCFTPDEWSEIQVGGLSEFYRYWTVKEAVIKLIGHGMGHIAPLDIEVEVQQAHYRGDTYSIDSQRSESYCYSVASRKRIHNCEFIRVAF